MKRLVLFLLAAGPLVLGCAAKPVAPSSPFVSSQELDGLAVTLTAPPKTYHVGESMPVTIAVQNQSKSPIQVQSLGSDLVQVKVYHQTDVGWEQALQFPEIALPVVTPWTLAPGAQRSWTLNIPIEPTWPSDATIRLVGVLNGLPGPAPTVTFRNPVVRNTASSQP